MIGGGRRWFGVRVVSGLLRRRDRLRRGGFGQRAEQKSAQGTTTPAPDDLGVPIAAVARHRAELLEQPVYGGPYARAAALVHTLGCCRWLERSNLTVARAVAVMYLNASGIPADPAREQLSALAHELYDPRCSTARLAELLRTWRP